MLVHSFSKSVEILLLLYCICSTVNAGIGSSLPFFSALPSLGLYLKLDPIRNAIPNSSDHDHLFLITTPLQ
jgi:hypothetical protein